MRHWRRKYLCKLSNGGTCSSVFESLLKRKLPMCAQTSLAVLVSDDFAIDHVVPADACIHVLLVVRSDMSKALVGYGA